MRNRFLILLSLISTAFASCIGNQEDEILEINGVKFNVTSTEMAIGDSLQLRATVLPYDKAFEKVQWDENIKESITWKSDNSSVATVDPDGIVRAVGKGTCNVYLICGTFFAKCAVIVRNFSIESIYGQWLSQDSASYYFQFNDTYSIGDSQEELTWSFDGMRIMLKQSDTLIVTATEPGRLECYNASDPAKSPISLHMVAHPITASKLAHNLVEVEGNDGRKYQAVDMKLPSGLLWGTCNLGADTPSASGHFFAWGETEPKQTYTLENYKWYDTANMEITKYKSRSHEDFVILDGADDAAAVNMGGQWRMPSDGDIRELCECSFVVWSKLDGVDGLLFIGKNCTGSSIFLPLTGVKESYSQSLDEMLGIYWSSVLCSTDEFTAYALELYNIPDRAFYKAYFPGTKVKRATAACIRPVARPSTF